MSETDHARAWQPCDPAPLWHLEPCQRSATEKAAADRLLQIIATKVAGDAKLRLLDGEKQTAEIALTPALSGLLMDVLRHIGRGNTVTLVPVSQMLTTQQATDIFNVSRPYLISLVDRAEIEHTVVGRHRRITAEICSRTYNRSDDCAGHDYN